jgi:hypothetical protein
VKAVRVAFAAAIGLSAAPAVALGPQTSPEIEHQVRTILEQPAFGFCHSAEYPLSEAERSYCPLVGPSSSVCTKLPEACQNDRYPEMVTVDHSDEQGRKITDFGEDDGKRGAGRGGTGPSKDGGSAGDGDRSARDSQSSPEKKQPEPPPEPMKIEIPGWLAALGQILFYALIAAFVVALVYWIVKNVIKGRAEKLPDEDKPEVEKETIAITAPQGPVETDVDRLLARAQRAAQAGDYREAVEATYAALLRRLEGDGLVDLHPSRTNGDYVRQMRERPELRQALRGIAVDVERMQFGTEQPSPSLFESIRQRVLPLVGRAAVLFFVLVAAGSQLSCGRLEAKDTLAVGEPPPGGAAPFGNRAILELLGKRGKNVVMNRDHREKGEDIPRDRERTIILFPDAPVDKDGWRKLMRWVRLGGGQLIVAGHRKALEDELGIGWAQRYAEAPVRPTPSSYPRLMGFELAVPRFGRLVLEDPDDQRNRVLLARSEGEVEEPYAVERTFVSDANIGRIVVIADDGLFKNVAMTAGDNAAYVVELIGHLGSKDIEVWDAYTSYGSSSSARGASSPLESLKESKLAPVLLHLLALVVLYIVYRGTRFGTPNDPKAASRRAFSDHARALGQAYARAKASRHALGLYTVWAIERLRDRFGGARQRGLAPLAEAVAQRTGEDPAQVAQVLSEATAARDEVAPPSSFRPGAAVLPAPETGPRRDFWIMQKLEGYLAASHGKAKR